jgi:hypothetical protein
MGNLSLICEDRADKRKKWDDVPDEEIFKRVSQQDTGFILRTSCYRIDYFQRGLELKDVEVFSVYRLFSSTINFLMLIFFIIYMILYLKLRRLSKEVKYL